MIIISQNYYQKTCQSMQDFQVLSYDYLKRIDDHINRREQLVSQLQDQSRKTEALRQMVEESRQTIK